MGLEVGSGWGVGYKTGGSRVWFAEMFIATQWFRLEPPSILTGNSMNLQPSAGPLVDLAEGQPVASRRYHQRNRLGRCCLRASET